MTNALSKLYHGWGASGVVGVGGWSMQYFPRGDSGALLKALRPTGSRLSGRKNRPIRDGRAGEARDEKIIIIKIINRIYEIFFFSRTNNTVKTVAQSENIILLQMPNRQRLETRPHNNTYVHLVHTHIICKRINTCFFCFDVFFLYVYTGDFYLLSVA